jgi:hypothetical protein
MSTETFIKYLCIIALVLFYIGFTISHSIKFSKSILFSKKIKIIHIVLFFLIPFIWLFFLKEFSKSALGSHHFPNKVDDIPGSDAYTSAA